MVEEPGSWKDKLAGILLTLESHLANCDRDKDDYSMLRWLQQEIKELLK